MAHILLVEDVDVVRLVLKRMLERAGHTVAEAADGGAALAMLAESAPDLVVTDIWMPGMDGISLIRQARERNPALKVIAVSGGAPRAPQEFSIREARAAGADEALLKPVDKQELADAVARLLAAA
jgi:CheY-like chemotaxis protein